MPTFKKNKKQIEATKLLGSIAKHILLRGGSRSGKTLLLVRAIIIRACKEPNSRHLILRKHFNSVKQSIWYDTLPTVIDICFPELKGELKYNKSDWFVLLPNGSEVWFGGLDDKERTEKILGKEYSTIFFNECSEMLYESVSMAYTRLAQKNGLKKKFYYDCNPPKRGHWSEKIFIRKCKPDSATDEPLKNPDNYATIKINPRDNEENLDADYIPEILENLPPALRLRFLEGEYGSDDTDIIKSEWIKPTERTSNQYACIITFVDPAISQKETADETAIVTIGIEYITGTIHELESLHGRWTIDKIREKCNATWLRHKADFFYVETVQAQDWLAQDLRSMGVPAIGFKPDVDKIRKALSVQKYFEDDRVRINSPVAQKQILEFQQCVITNTGIIDVADALISALVILKKTSSDEKKNPPHWQSEQRKLKQQNQADKVFKVYHDYASD